MTYRSPFYSALLKVILRPIGAERAHRLVARWMRLTAAIPGAVALIDRLLRPRDPGLRVHVMGLGFRSPLGVAAGVDKDATWFGPLAALGFGSVEIGTVTAEGQEGNPARPRVTRLPRDRALINAMGFPNHGSGTVAERLRDRRPGGVVIGANIGKTKTVELDDAVDDYRLSARRLAPCADYLVLNVSSPNTPGLREMQAVGRLGALVDGVREEMSATDAERPLLVKLSADLADAELEEIADLALERKLEGIIAVNTTTDTSQAGRSAPELAAQSHGGGISGPPLRERSLEVLRLLRERTGGHVALISVGGVESHHDVWERILAGASLVQAYTGIVYGGPLWAWRVNRGLSGLLRDSPWASLDEAVGRDG